MPQLKYYDSNTSQWVTAVVGAQGTTGAQGVQGPTGAQGADGTQGATGTQGSLGTQGILGAQGPQGPQGETGTQGANGTQGVQGVQGPEGTQGVQGTQGIQGYSGADGNSSSYYNYKADTSITSGDPGNGGTLYWNNATQTSATVIVIDHLTDTGVDVDVFLALLKTGDTIIIQDASDSANYQQWTVNGAETIYPNNYVTVPVTLETSAGTGTTGFANNHDLIVVIIAAGVQGPTGAQGTAGAQGAQGIQGTTGTISPDDSWYYSILF